MESAKGMIKNSYQSSSLICYQAFDVAQFVFFCEKKTTSDLQIAVFLGVQLPSWEAIVF